MEQEIEELLELHTLEELFDILDITPQEVIEILIKNGYVELPEYVRRDSMGLENEESEET